MDETTSMNALFHPGDAEDFFLINGLPAFDPAATSAYSRGNALWLIETSRLVYREDTASRKKFFHEHANLEEVRFFDKGATQGTLVRGDGFAILAFRGTLGHRDFLTDLDFRPEAWGGAGEVHIGFQKQLNIVWPEVKQELDNLDVPVFYTGHSLGAALATLTAARRFLEGGKPPVAVYSFGSPRVGTRGFRRAFPANFLHYRVVNDRDLVPTVPPLPFVGLFGPDFHHVGTPHQIEHDGRLRRGNLNDDENAVTSFFKRFATGFDSFRSKLNDFLTTGRAHLSEEFTDHAPVNYTARIERAGDLA